MNNALLFTLLAVGIVGMTLLGSLGGFFFKRSTSGASVLSIIRNKNVYIGVLFYVLGAGVNILVLKKLPYSVVYPLSAITYVWSLVLSVLVLKEKLTRPKLIGIASILVGAAFFAADGVSSLLR